MSQDSTELLFLRDLAHRMSSGIDVQARSHMGLHYHNVFYGQDAIDWLIADSRSGAADYDSALSVGQRLLDNGFVQRVSRQLRTQRFGRHRVKRRFRGGHSFYRFDHLRISPFHLHVVVRRAEGLRSMDASTREDPYVQLKVGMQRAETKVERHTTEPQWQEHFVFGVDNVDSQQLRLRVLDYGSFKHDDLIGECTVGLSSLPVYSGKIERGEAGLSDQDGDGGADGPGSWLAQRFRGRGSAPAAQGMDASTRDSRSNTTDSSSTTGTGVSSPATLLFTNGQPWQGKFGLRRRAATLGREDHDDSIGEGVKLPAGGEEQDNGRDDARWYPLSLPSTRKMRKRQRSDENNAPTDDESMATDSSTVGGFRSSVGGSRSSAEQRGRLACSIWLTSFQPHELHQGGMSRLELHCRILEVCGATSYEERKHCALHIGGVWQRCCLKVADAKISTEHFEKTKRDLRAKFDGQPMLLRTTANKAIDVLKLVVYQKTIGKDHDIGERPVASLALPLHLIPMAGGEEQKGPAVDPTEPTWHSLQTQAGPFTSHIMENGRVLMAVWLAPALGGDNLLGEEHPEDQLPAEGEAWRYLPPRANVLLEKVYPCGYRRLRLAFLEQRSKLMDTYGAVSNVTEREVSPWVSAEGAPLPPVSESFLPEGAKRTCTYIIPKSAMVSANKANEDNFIRKDGPTGFCQESHVFTPDVPFGSTFYVVTQYQVSKEGPSQSRVRLSCETVFKSRPLVAGTIESGVVRGCKGGFATLGELIDEALGQGRGPPGSAKQAATASNRAGYVMWAPWCGAAAVVLWVLCSCYLGHFAGIPSVTSPEEYRSSHKP